MKKNFVTVYLLFIFLVCFFFSFSATSAFATLLYDNNPTDGSNGYSNAALNVVSPGERHSLLDDFVVPGGQTWNINEIEWTHLWNTLNPGSGTGLELFFLADSGGSPGAAITGFANVTNYNEVATGNVWFGRSEAQSNAQFNAVTLTAGTYWFLANIIGPEQNFWMIHPTVNNSESWALYTDFGGLQSGTTLFGSPADLNFKLSGSIQGGQEPIPEPTTMLLLGTGLVGVAGAARKRKKKNQV